MVVRSMRECVSELVRWAFGFRGHARRVLLTWSQGVGWEIEMKEGWVVRSLES